MESTKRARKHSKSSADLAKHKETSRSSLPPPLSTKSASRERVKSAPQLSEEPQKLKAHGQSTSRSTVPLGSSSTRAPTSPSTPRSRKSSNSWEGSNRLAEVRAPPVSKFGSADPAECHFRDVVMTNHLGQDPEWIPRGGNRGAGCVDCWKVNFHPISVRLEKHTGNTDRQQEGVLRRVDLRHSISRSGR